MGRGLLASMGFHALALGALVAVPLIAQGESPPLPRSLPPVVDTVVLTAPAAPAPRPVRPAPPRLHPAHTIERIERAPAASLPPAVPDLVPTADPIDAAPGCIGCAVSHGGADGGPGSGSDPDGTGADSSPSGGDSTPLVVGRGVSAPAKLRHVDPQYPELARRAGMQGTVVIECVIDAQGKVARARVLRGAPLLDAAALAAVQQWLYRPTLLNGVAVPVVMTVTVRFHLR